MHKTNSSTTTPRLQANNAVNTTLPFNTIRQHLGEIVDQAAGILALNEMVHQQLDAIGEATHDPVVLNIVVRLEELTKAASRNATLIMDASTATSLALEKADEVAA